MGSQALLSSLIFLIAVVEFGFAIYTWLCDPANALNRAMAALLVLIGLSTLTISLLANTFTVREAEFWLLVRVATTAMITPGIYLVSIMLLRPRWLRHRWLTWSMLGLLLLPMIAALLDGTGVSHSVFGQSLIYSRPDPLMYTGGVSAPNEYSGGLLRLPEQIILYGLPVLTLICPDLVVALRDRKKDPLNSQTAWILFFGLLLVIVAQVGLSAVLSMAVRVLLANLIAFSTFLLVILRSDRPTLSLAGLNTVFNNWSIFAKLMAILLTILVPTLSITNFVASTVLRINITRQVGDNLASLAINEARGVGNELLLQISNLQRLNQDDSVAAAFEARASSYAQQTAAERSLEIARREADWQQAAGMEALVEASMAHPEALAHFSSFGTVFPDHLRIVLTDQFGALITATSPPENYDSSGTTWWQQAYNEGFGDIYISEPYFDQETGQNLLVIALPVFGPDQTEVIGVSQSLYTLDTITRRLDEIVVGDNGASALFDSDLRPLASDPVAEPRQIALNWDHLLGGDNQWNVLTYQSEDAVVAWATVGEEFTEGPLQSLGWRVLVSQATEEALASIDLINRLALFTLLAAALAAFILLVVLARRITGPIRSLTAIAEQAISGEIGAHAPVEGRDEIGLLATSFNLMTDQLRGLVSGLEKQVAERTRELEDRAAKLQAAAEVGSAITSMREFQELLSEITRMISSRFGYYHVAVYLLDANQEYAVIRAANSPGGQKLLAQGYRLKVGKEGLIGLVVGSREARIARSIASGQRFVLDPELSETRSRIGLPLSAGGKLLGALDIQSRDANAFSAADISTLHLLASQLSAAIENADLFAENQRALAETNSALEAARRAYSQLSQAGWRELLQTQEEFSYTVRASSTSDGDQQPEPAGSERVEQANGETQLSVPIRIRDNLAGQIRLKKSRSWNEDEIRLAEAISDQLSQALESARLFRDTQKRSAQLQTSANVAQAAASILELDELLPTVVDLIAEQMSLYYVGVFMVDEERKWAILRAGTGEAGRAQIDANHRLEVGGHSMIGQCVARNEARIALDVGAEPVHFQNPFLPATRSEMALPLTTRGETIGALTIQSDLPGAFTDEDITVLQTLANQLVKAIQNAKLFQETQELLESEQLQRMLASRLARVATRMAESLSEKETRQILLQEVHDVVLPSQISLYESVAGGKGLRLAIRKLDEEQVEDLYVVGQLIARASRPDIWQVYDSEETRLTVETGEDGQVHEHLLLPWYVGQQRAGVVELYHAASQPAIRQEDQSAIEGIIRQAAVALQSARSYEQMQAALARTQTLYQVSQSVIAFEEITSMLRSVVNEVAENLPADRVTLVTFDQRARRITNYLVGGTGADQVAASVTYQELMSGLSGWVLKHLSPALSPKDVPDFREDAQAQQRRQENLTGSMIVVPLVYQDQVFGTMTAINAAHQEDFSEEDLELMSTMANQTAAALANASLLAELQARAVQLQTAAEVSRAASSILDLGELLPQAVELIRERFDLYYVGVFLVDDAQQWAVLRAGTGEAGQIQIEQDHRLLIGGESMIGQCIATEAARIALDVGREAIHFRNPVLPLTRSEMALPLRARGETIGALTVQSEVAAAFGKEDATVLQTLSDQLAVAIDNARSFQLLQEATLIARARVDELSTLFDLSQSLSSAPMKTEEIAELTVRRMVEIVGGATGCGLGIYDPDSDTMEMIADMQVENGEPEFSEDPSIWNYQLSDYPATRSCMETMKPLVIRADDPQADPHEVDYLNTIGSEALLIIPLAAQGEAFGVIEMDHWAQAVDFNQDLLNYVMTIANQAAAALENARTYELAQQAFDEARARVQELSTLFDISQILYSTTLQSEQIAQAAIENLLDAVGGATNCSLSIYDPETGDFDTIAQLGTEHGKLRVPDDSNAWNLRLSDFPPTNQVIETLRPILTHLDDPDIDPATRDYLKLVGVDTNLLLPLVIKGRALGVIQIESWLGKREYSAEQINLGLTIANQTAAALENARLYEDQLETAEKLRELDQLKNQFLANMSHELRTPLNSIIGFSRVMLKEIDGPITGLQEQDLTAIYNAGHHLLGLINDILDLSRIEAKKMELNIEEIDLAAIVTSVMATARGLIKEQAVDLQLDLDPELPKLRADPTRIRQILLNLLQNSAKFTEEGFIRVEVRRQVSADNAPQVFISVQDSGIGISEDDLEKLFLPFSQVDPSPTRKTGGTGLGLSITRNLVELHGGTIKVSSEVGKGSTFSFVLPALPDHGAESEISNQRILVIDDDPQIVQLYRRYLEPEGYEVIPLTNAAQALQAAKKYRPSAITLDVRMPDASGWEVISSLKEDPDTRDIPVIFCTIDENQAKGMQLGADQYLLKPILKEDLLGALTLKHGETL